MSEQRTPRTRKEPSALAVRAGTGGAASPESTPGESSLAARRSGAAEAEALDLRLCLREGLEREKLLTERALKAEEALEDALRNEHDLRDQIERFARFHRAVERSLPWRAIQFLRRLAGREW